jgi:parvulin-like peptidyl-prolyl isomerase
MRMTLLAEALHRAVRRRIRSPSTAEVVRYYHAHRAKYREPQRRDVLVVETKTRNEAMAARRGAAEGQSFGDLAQRWSVDPTTRRQGGRLRGLTRGLRGAAVEREMFAARRGELVGPIATPLGFGVFKVTAIHRARSR